MAELKGYPGEGSKILLPSLSQRTDIAFYNAPEQPHQKETCLASKGYSGLENLSTIAYLAMRSPLEAVYPLWRPSFNTSTTLSFTILGIGNPFSSFGSPLPREIRDLGEGDILHKYSVSMKWWIMLSVLVLTDALAFD